MRVVWGSSKNFNNARINETCYVDWRNNRANDDLDPNKTLIEYTRERDASTSTEMGESCVWKRDEALLKAFPWIQTSAVAHLNLTPRNWRRRKGDRVDLTLYIETTKLWEPGALVYTSDAIHITYTRSVKVHEKFLTHIHVWRWRFVTVWFCHWKSKKNSSTHIRVRRRFVLPPSEQLDTSMKI